MLPLSPLAQARSRGPNCPACAPKCYSGYNEGAVMGAPAVAGGMDALLPWSNGLAYPMWVLTPWLCQSRKWEGNRLSKCWHKITKAEILITLCDRKAYRLLPLNINALWTFADSGPSRALHETHGATLPTLGPSQCYLIEASCRPTVLSITGLREGLLGPLSRSPGGFCWDLLSLSQ